MNPKDREKEVMEYLRINVPRSHAVRIEEITKEIVQAILRSYELYPLDDMPRGE